MPSSAAVPSPARPPLSKHSPSALSAGVQALQQALATPPLTPDGLTDDQARAPSDPAHVDGFLKTLWKDAANGRLDDNIDVLLQGLKGAGSPIDDRKFLLEHVVTALQAMSPESGIQQKTTGALIDMLWHDLPHPPTAYLGKDYKWRSADGSGNSLVNPQLGAAGTPYARSVSACHPSPNNLPDPSVVFDALLRRDEFKPHPAGISSLLFAMATLVTHSCFETDMTNPDINKASSYLDLSPLYGSNQTEQDLVRTHKNGLVHADTVPSKRLSLMPPAVMALLLVYSRNHNYVAEKLLKINERGTFREWSDDPQQAAAMKAQDEEIFQTARLINCGYFMNVIFQDYIKAILALNQTDSIWSLVATGEIRSGLSGMAERGTGNAVSCEFSILYRWHAAISQKDERWLEDAFRPYLNGRSFDEMTRKDLGIIINELKSKMGDDDLHPKTWTFGGLKRDPVTGLYNDDELVQILTEATDEVAGAFGAKGSPVAMKVIDMMSIATARNTWNVCSMNEFRKFLNLKPFESFTEWNNDPSIASVAEHLYGHIDNLELFAGLQAEQPKPSMAASGLCPGYTISRAILSDAVALSRGDRFFTTGANTGTLTSWGLGDVTPDPEGGSKGGLMGKLLMRAFPNSYAGGNSVYAFFPFSTPETTRRALAQFGNDVNYDFSPPKKATVVKSVRTYAACKAVLTDHERFGVFYGPAIQDLTKNACPFFISTDVVTDWSKDRKQLSAALFPAGWQDRLTSFTAHKTAELVKTKSFTYDGGKTRMLDVVRDVTNMIPVYWVSHQFGMPLKTPQTPRALLTPQELRLILSAFFCHVFMNFDNPSSFKLGAVAKKSAKVVEMLVDVRLAQAGKVPEIVNNLISKLQKMVVGEEVESIAMGQEATDFYRRLLKDNTASMEHLNSMVTCTMTASVANQGQAAANVINFYLSSDRKAEYTHLCQLAKEDSPEADAKVLAYIYEALRLDPQVPFVPRVVKEDAVIPDGDRTVEVKKGEYLFPSIKNSGLDETVYPNPQNVDITRDFSGFMGFGAGIHECLGAVILRYSLVASIKEVFKLKNVRRAPGKSGQLQRFFQEVAETQCPVYMTPQATISPLPSSLSIVWDA